MASGTHLQLLVLQNLKPLSIKEVLCLLFWVMVGLKVVRELDGPREDASGVVVGGPSCETLANPLFVIFS